MDGLSPARRIRRDEGNAAKLEGPTNGAFLFGVVGVMVEMVEMVEILAT